MTYYTTLDHYANVYDRTVKSHAFSAPAREEFALWRDSARARLREISGLDLCERIPAKPALHETTREFGFQKDSMLLETEPGVFVPFWLYRPRRPNGAAVLLPHGHGGGKEMTLRMITDGRPFIEILAEQGYYVLCPDGRGAGERRELPEQKEEFATGNSHRELNNIAIGFGGSVLGAQIWDLMRLVDFAREELHAARIGCAGLSGGGQQTLWLAALDDRIDAAVTSGYFYGVKEALLRLPQNCACNFVPFFWRTMDIGDLAAMLAPRPLFVESGRIDQLNGATGLDNVYPQVEITKKAYRLFDAEQSLIHSVHEEGHKWIGTGVAEFLGRHLLGK